jgi:cytochrome c
MPRRSPEADRHRRDAGRRGPAARRRHCGQRQRRVTRRCETCHGPTGTEGPQDTLAGGKGSLATPKPLKTVGSYWPYATTLWDYINRAMPFDHPSTLTPDEVYSAAAYVLFLNGIVGEQDVLDQTTLPKVQMPNRNGFVADPRPDIPPKKK